MKKYRERMLHVLCNVSQTEVPKLKMSTRLIKQFLNYKQMNFTGLTHIHPAIFQNVLYSLILSYVVVHAGNTNINISNVI